MIELSNKLAYARLCAGDIISFGSKGHLQFLIFLDNEVDLLLVFDDAFVEISKFLYFSLQVLVLSD